MVDSVRNFSDILADSAYGTPGISGYVFENTHAIPVICTNKRRGIVPERLPLNRKIGIDLRKEYSRLYTLRWEIERTFSILEEIMKTEYAWHTKNRDCDNHYCGNSILSLCQYLPDSLELPDFSRFPPCKSKINYTCL